MKKLLLTFLIAFITALGLNATTVTKSITSFSSTSGNIDDNISYAAAKGGGTTQVVVKSNEIRIYKPASGKKLGGEITISAANECKINSVTISAGEKTANVNIYLDGSSTATKSNLTFSNKKEVSIDGISASSVRFVDVGADRIDIASIEVTYTTAGGDTPGPKVLGDIKMGSTPVSTDKTTPTTATVKGGGTISFTSENAAAMIVYQDGVQNVSSGGSTITWEAPEATDSEQSLSLRIHSQLKNEGEDLQEKDAYMTVTVPAKGNVSDDFTLITDAGDLYDGMEMYIVSGTIALSTTQNKNNRGQTGVSIKNGILTPTPLAQLITLEATNVTDKPWKFNVGDRYLYAASSSSNYLKTSDSPSYDNEKATISIETNGNATITFKGTNTRNVLKYNSNDKLFSCYTSGQTAVQIYAKKTMTAVAPEAPTFTPDGGDVDLFSTVKIACATEGATLTYKIGDGEAKAYPADGIKMTEAGEVTITAIATKNGLSTETTKTFNVTDMREEVYIMFDENEYEFTVGEEFESPVAKACTYNNGDFVEIPDFTETINYESDNTSVAEVNATTGALTLKAAGTCKIKASLKSETYKSDPDYYTLTVNKGLVDGLIEYPVSEFVYTIGSEATLPELVKEPADVDVEYSISHKRVENGVAVYHPATIDEQGNITVNTPGIVTVTATVKANPTETSSYVLEIQSLKEAETSASTVKAPVVHITGGNVYYSPDGEWYWGTEDESHKLSFANETDGAQIYYTMTSATPSSANVRAMANSATRTLYSTPFKKSDLDGKKITFWAEKDGQKSAVETLNFNIKTGIEDIDVENGEAIEEEGDARYFNLQGLEVKNPGEGIYIRVANGKATKILKK